MTNEQINRAIAEACGWTEFHTEDFTEMGMPCFVQMALPPGFIHIENSMPLPNYCNDLNAMHEAEKTMLAGFEDDPEGSALWSDYQTNLIIVCPAYLSYHATANQRAEAFLRTINKWEDEK